MNHTKNILAIILALIISVTFSNIPLVGATEVSDSKLITKTTGNCTSVYNPETGHLTISGSGIIDGRLVTDCENIKSVDIQEGITEIKKYTFLFAYKLSEVSLPDTLTKIGYCAFADARIKELTIPENVHTIEEHAFRGCDFTEVVIPDNVSRLETYAFDECTNLKKVVISKGVSGISGNPFTGCNKLKTIEIEKGNKSYKTIDNALVSKDSKEFIYYPLGKKDKSYKLPTKVTYIHDEAFSGADFKKVALPDNLKTIGKRAFYCCDKLKELIIPDSVTTIDKRAFSGCSSLKKIKIGKGLKKIKHDCFESCTSLKKVTIPKTVETIGSHAFSNCTNLEKVTIENGVKTIGSSAFYDCDKLKSVFIPKSVKKINCTAFGFHGSDDIVPGFVLKGYKNTAAERYAKEESHISDYRCDILMFRNIEKKTEIKVNTPEITIKPNKTRLIKPNIKEGYGNTAFKSRNRKIAQVTQKGVVTGISKGTAKIVVINNGYRKAVTITVK